MRLALLLVPRVLRIRFQLREPNPHAFVLSMCQGRPFDLPRHIVQLESFLPALEKVGAWFDHIIRGGFRKQSGVEMNVGGRRPVGLTTTGISASSGTSFLIIAIAFCRSLTGSDMGLRAPMPRTMRSHSVGSTAFLAVVVA